jgi:hypothetical protein
MYYVMDLFWHATCAQHSSLIAAQIRGLDLLHLNMQAYRIDSGK